MKIFFLRYAPAAYLPEEVKSQEETDSPERFIMPRTIAEEYRLAIQRPADGPYPALAAEVRKLLGYDSPGGERFMTARAASAKCGVAAASLTGALRGDRLSVESLLKIATGLGGDPDQLLRVAGYSEYSRPPRRRVGAGDTGDPNEIELTNIFRDLLPDRKRLLVAIARTMLVTKDSLIQSRAALSSSAGQNSRAEPNGTHYSGEGGGA